MRRSLLTTIVLLFFIVVGMVLGAVLQGQARLTFGQAAVATATAAPIQANASVSAETQLFRTIYSQANPSVVAIQVRIPSSNLTQSNDNGFGNPNQAYQMAAGSGFVYDTQGHIITNAHVVQGSDQVEVTFSDGNMMRAKITGIDLDADLAVVQVDGDISKYTPLPIADSDTVQVGDMAIAIGNPFEKAGTMTHGIISALHRTVQGLHTSGSGAYSIPDALQTDTPLNPGNSGGPLLNEFGQVIGVNEQIEAPAGQSSGISFAIPSNLLRMVAPALIQNGSMQHSYLGISTVSLTLDLNDQLNLPANTHGALITGVSQGGPAARAGIKAAATANSGNVSGGDVIVAVDKQPINNSDDLIAYLFTKTTVGQTVTMTVLRNGKQQDLQVKLAARPK